MTRHAWRFVVLGAIGLVAWIPPSAAADAGPEPLDKALARPLSPGSVALLLPHVSQPGAVKRLVEALGDPRPEVRAVAARVAFVTRHEGLAAALVTALEKEDASTAGAEMVRALTLIKGSAADAVTLPALERLGPGAATAWMQVVGRTRPQDLAVRLPRLPAIADAPFADALGSLLRTNPEASAGIVPLVGRDAAADVAYAGMLARAHISHDAPPWELLRAGLTVPGLRPAVLVLLYQRHLRGLPVPAEAPGMIAELERTVDAEDGWTRTVLELGRRAEGRPVRPLTAPIDRLDLDRAPAGLWTSRLLELLEPTEGPALGRRAATMFVAVDGGSLKPAPLVRRPFMLAPAVFGPVGTAAGVTRTPRPLVSTLVEEVAQLSGCRPGAAQMAVLGIAYRPTGQVRHVNTRLAAPSERCTQAAVVLAALDVAPGEAPVPAERADMVLAGFRPVDVSCERAPARARRTLRVGDRGITPPRKIRHVNPHYPEVAQDQRLQGVVIVEATISPAGCVAEAVVVRRVGPALDLAALVAVTQWQYEPTRLDGEVVPVSMTVTVNFTLR